MKKEEETLTSARATNRAKKNKPLINNANINGKTSQHTNPKPTKEPVPGATQAPVQENRPGPGTGEIETALPVTEKLKLPPLLQAQEVELEAKVVAARNYIMQGQAAYK